ncbi:ABC transporter permease [candidate division KSB1 bacterium]|nr:ABC transporter permease [candidate division KSB1 bacterium]
MRAKASMAILLIIGAWIVNFSLLYWSPGDVTSRYWGPEVDAVFLQNMRIEKGLHLSYWQQLVRWTGNLLRGDLGYSWTHHRPVMEIFAETLPATLQLALLALVIQFFVGGALGMLSALWKGRKFGMILDAASLAIYAMPSFWLAMLLIYFFSMKLNWLPASGMQSMFSTNFGLGEWLLDRAWHLFLPGSILGLVGAVATMRFVRARMIEQMNKPFVLLARAKGLSTGTILCRHIFKVALLPMVTQLGLAFPVLLSGTLVIEVVFAWPGMGRLVYEALLAKDYPVILAANFMTAVLVAGGNLLADFLYRLVDPRVRI